MECESEYANHEDRTLHQGNLRLYADLTKILARSNLMGFGRGAGSCRLEQSLPPDEPA